MKYTTYTYEQFLIELKVRLEKHFGDGYEIVLEKMFRNNSCMTYGFIISEKCNADYPHVSPVINTEDMYKEYICGRSLDSIINRIDYIYEMYLKEDFRDIHKINAENAEQCVFYRLINYDMNREMLDSVPHIRFLDLAIIFHYLYNINEDSIQSIRINNKMIDDWQCTAEQLMEMAERNTPVLFPGKLDTMKNVIESLMEREFEEFLSDEEIAERKEMYVLSNNQASNGATAILYSNKIKEVSELYQQDIVIIPSSIHEVILLPVKEKEEAVNLHELVENVNKEHVAKEEVLSDNVYFYDRQKDKLEIFDL